ncbi:hypothetical protein [Alteromonas sp. ASW11-130]|uniref:hypothetical protein n=1 Tax=Alteromonas sp. ASW11-130 TaxID=3015775 RepID=UPI00224219FE|nr:hypothetical protein [Alteromonas sp. ASW11-130]MCW8090431.1 hypothetical protein [Alteromonas sp. ASW11-130]
MNSRFSRLYTHVGLFATLRAFIIFLAAFLLLQSFHYGTAYLASQQSVQNVNMWFTEGQISSQAEVVETLAALQQADEQLPFDAQIKIALAKLYILLSESHNTSKYLSLARIRAQQAKVLQPTHFEADSLMVLLDDKHHAPTDRFIAHLRIALKSGGLEQTGQLILGPAVVARWEQLPEDIRQLAGPMIKSMLSEEGVREVLFAAMHDAKLYRPFAKFSPNRKTSALLRKLDKEKG